MNIKKYFNTLLKLKKENKQLKKDQKLMIQDIEEFDKRLSATGSVISKQYMELSQIYSNSRDMFFGPKEFIIGRSIPEFKKIKVLIGKEDITDKVSKIVISGPSLIKL